MAKRNSKHATEQSTTGKVKKPLYKKVWFWVVVVIIVGAIGSGMSGGDKKEDKKSANSTAKTEQKTTTSTSKATKTSESKKEEKTDTTLQTNFDAIKIGDILAGGDGGSSLDEVKAIFGEPGSQTESAIEGITSKVLTWTGVKGGTMLATIVVSFSNDKAVTKAVTGLKTAKHDKVTLEQFNAVVTDGSFTEDTAKSQFGDPDSISTSIINSAEQKLVGWSSNVKGDLGANFNITFDGGTATAKSNFGMK